MKVLSVVTAVFDPRHLLAAYESLRDQDVPDDWSWEWVVQEDGLTGAPRAVLPNDPRIVHGNSRHAGVAVTRNLALARSRGEFVKNLDADDLLQPGVLARDVMTLAAVRDIGWTTSRAADLLPDGSIVDHDHPPGGRLNGRDVIESWRRNDYQLPIHPATICLRRDLAVALGGWMALPASEDTGLLIAACSQSDGYFHDETGLLYRKWPGQATADAAHTDTDERNVRMRLIDQRASALLTS